MMQCRYCHDAIWKDLYLHHMQRVDGVTIYRIRLSLTLRTMEAGMRAMGMEMKDCHGRL